LGTVDRAQGPPFNRAARRERISMQVTKESGTFSARADELVCRYGKHPLVAVGIGVVVGFVVARAVRR
jgi:hypothetical protein